MNFCVFSVVDSFLSDKLNHVSINFLRESILKHSLINDQRRVQCRMASSKSLVVLGVGNSIRMDDAAGLRVVEGLEREKSLQGLDVSFKYLHTGGLDILDEIDGYKHAIIVDAASMADKGLKPGEFFHLKNLHDLKDQQPSGVVSSHGIGVLEVLKYAKIGGYQIPDPIEIYGIQVKEIGFVSEELTPEVEEAVNKLIVVLKSEILDFFSEF